MMNIIHNGAVKEAPTVKLAFLQQERTSQAHEKWYSPLGARIQTVLVDGKRSEVYQAVNTAQYYLLGKYHLSKLSDVIPPRHKVTK